MGVGYILSASASTCLSLDRGLHLAGVASAGAPGPARGAAPLCLTGDRSLTSITRQQPTLGPCSLVWVLCPASLSWAAGDPHSEGLGLTRGNRLGVLVFGIPDRASGRPRLCS